MKKLLMASAAAALMAGGASADEIKLGVILGFTGPIESLTPAMAGGAALTYFERYFLLKFFQIPTAKDDPEFFKNKTKESFGLT